MLSFMLYADNDDGDDDEGDDSIVNVSTVVDMRQSAGEGDAAAVWIRMWMSIVAMAEYECNYLWVFVL